MSERPPLALSRRTLLGGGASLALCLAAFRAAAMGRVPLGGSVKLRVPWSTRSLDPHDLADPLAALFGLAAAEPVYALDRPGRPYPTLAHGMPRIEQGQTVVRLRPGLRSGRGRPLTGRDLAWSVNRARNMGAAGWLGELRGPAVADPGDGLAVRFGAIEPFKLSLLLASPLVALVPSGFSPRAPDGAGPFVAYCSAARLELRRNRNAARGPSFLERVTVRSAADLADSLRAFEAGRDDVGWLGLGLHRDRPGARRFDVGEVGWAVLSTGRSAGRFGRPGVAQQLANAVPIERQKYLGLRGRGSVSGSVRWGGEPAAILVPEQAGQLEAIAEAVAHHLSSPGHELSVTPVSRAKLQRALRGRDFALAIHVVRQVAPGPLATLIALATAERASLGRDLARHPPKQLGHDAPHELTRTLRLGVLGAVGVHGGAIGEVRLAPARPYGSGFDLGNSFRRG